LITIREITQQVKAEKALKDHQRRLRAFFESPLLGAIYWNMNGAITDANDRFLEMMGYTRDELVTGKVKWTEMTPAAYAAADEHALAELRATGIDTPYEKEYIRKDGGHIPILIGAVMLDERRQDGIAFVIDVSSRKKAEQAARESEEQFRTLAESMPNLAFWAEPDGSVTWYNRRWYEYTGIPREQMAGWGWRSLHDAAMLPQVVERWRAALQSGDSFEMELPLRGADGQFRSFLARVVPVKYPNGTIRRWFGTYTDVSALRDARELLAKHKEELESVVAQRTAQLQEVVDELGAFSYSVSHDLRTPLRTIIGFGELLVTDHGATLPGEAKALLNRMVRAAQRMNALITDLLKYSQMSRGELYIEVLDPHPLIQEIVEANLVATPAATIHVVGPFPKVRASRVALQQCLANLVANAIKFSRPGVPPVVTIRAESEPDRVRLNVEDNGVGIAPQHRDRVWAMFERLSSNYDGTGVGLAIVRKAMERMGGQIGVESEVGVGSTFWIELPAPVGPEATR
jgi:PAS domain S-box-containing protein